MIDKKTLNIFLKLSELFENDNKLSNFDNSESLQNKYVIVRSYSAGVFAGYLKSRNGQEVELVNARRLWSWAGAASLSQLAKEGTSKPDECKFPIQVDYVLLTQAIEILLVTEKAKKSIDSVKIWSE